jgi:hypothetical protein
MPPPYETVEGADYPPSYPFGPAATWEPEEPRRRPWRRTLVVALLTALIIAAAGALLGVLWHFLSPTVPVLDTGQSGIVVNDPSPEEYVAADGWFTLIGFAFGLVAAVVAWLVMRRDRGPGLLLGVTIGALAAALVAWQVGREIGLRAYEHWRDTATAGATYHAPPDLHTHGALLVPAFAAVIVTTLLAGWSNDPDLEQPGAKPGYGHDLPAGAEMPAGGVLPPGVGLPPDQALPPDAGLLPGEVLPPGAGLPSGAGLPPGAGLPLGAGLAPQGGFQASGLLPGGEVLPEGEVPSGHPPVGGPPVVGPSADLPGRRDQG